MATRRILTLALWLTAAPAHASPRTDPTSGRAVFTGAATQHATSIVLDPAALGLGQLDEVYVALTGVLDHLRIDLDPFGTTPDLSSPGARVRAVEPSPGAMLAFIYHFAGNLTLGFEAHTAAPERFVSDRDALRYHTLGGGERDWVASVGGSIRITDELFFGAGVSHQNTFLRLRYARDTALEIGDLGGDGGGCGGAPCGLGNPLATERWEVDVRSQVLSTSNLRVNIGGIYQLARDVWLAVAYHTPPGFAVQSELTGDVTVTRAPRDGGGRIEGKALVEIQHPASVDAELRARLPLLLDLHVGGRWEDLSRLSAYDVRTYGSTLPRDEIPEWTQRPRGMHDAFAGWAGVEQIDTGEIRRPLFGGRLGFETSAVTDRQTSPVTIAPTSFTLDLGAQLRVSRGLTAQLSYGLQYFPTVRAETSAFDPRSRVDCIASGYNYATDACRAVREGYAISSAAGSYDRAEHALRIGLRYELF